MMHCGNPWPKVRSALVMCVVYFFCWVAAFGLRYFYFECGEEENGVCVDYVSHVWLCILLSAY